MINFIRWVLPGAWSRGCVCFCLLLLLFLLYLQL